MEKYKNYINGKFIEPLTKEYFEKAKALNTGEIMGIFPRSGAQDIDNAVTAARTAFQRWSQMPPPKRADIIMNIVHNITAAKKTFAEVIAQETGKSIDGALGEVKSATDSAEFAAGEGRRMFGQTTFSALDKRWVLMKRVPKGVCGMITAWNAPLAIIAWKMFPALICGNTVVVKPAEDTPMTAHVLAMSLEGTGIPDGVINIVHGIGEEAGKALIENKKVDIMSFTGSSEVGSLISDEYGKRMKTCSLEMGGKNGLLVLPDADLGLAVNAAITGAFSCAGQRCAATSRLIVQQEVYDEVVNKLVEKTKKLKIISKDISEPNDVGPVINKKQLAGIKAAIDKAKKDGATLLAGGTILDQSPYDKGLYIEPTVFADVDPMSDLAQKEIFGPVLAVIKCKDYEDGLRIMNCTNYGLTASIHTKNVNLALDAMDRIQAGCCYVNAPTFGSEAHIPFGGVKQSGNGHREPGTQALDVFSEWKTMYLDYSQINQNSQFASKNK